METIEERAKEYTSKNADISLSPIYNEALASIYEKAYIAGAKDQQYIDRLFIEQLIDKACKWLKENIEGGVHPQSAYGFVDRFRKAMEE